MLERTGIFLTQFISNARTSKPILTNCVQYVLGQCILCNFKPKLENVSPEDSVPIQSNILCACLSVRSSKTGFWALRGIRIMEIGFVV